VLETASLFTPLAPTCAEIKFASLLARLITFAAVLLAVRVLLLIKLLLVLVGLFLDDRRFEVVWRRFLLGPLLWDPFVPMFIILCGLALVGSGVEDEAFSLSS